MIAIGKSDSHYFGFALAVVLQMPHTPAQPRLAKRALNQLTEVLLVAARARGELVPLASYGADGHRRR
jgi:hypothetical protein